LKNSLPGEELSKFDLICRNHGLNTFSQAAQLAVE
jgi:hypothetical protein